MNNRKKYEALVSALYAMANKVEDEHQESLQFQRDTSPADNFQSACIVLEQGVYHHLGYQLSKAIDGVKGLLVGTDPGSSPEKYDPYIIEALNLLKVIWATIHDGDMDRFEKPEPIQNQYGTIELKYAPLGCPGDYVVSDHHGILENGDMHAQAESEEQLPYTEPDLFAFFVDMLTGKTLAESIEDDIMANQKVLITCTDTQYIRIISKLVHEYVVDLFRDLVSPDHIGITGFNISGTESITLSGKNGSQFKIGDGSCSWLEATRHYRQIALEG